MVRLKDAIALLRTELMEAINAAELGIPLQLSVLTADVELSVVLSKEATAGGKLTWSIIPALLTSEGSVGGKVGDVITHKVTLSLKPSYNGKDPLVSRPAAAIESAETVTPHNPR